MVDVYISLGSNIEDRLGFLTKALELIKGEISPIYAKSSIYETMAWGKKDQNDFLNQVICIKTDLDPMSLLNLLHSIENSLERKRMEKWGPRTIDLDILLYNNLIINHKDLIIPHPLMANRRFILLPFSEIAGETLHPVLRKTINDLSNTCLDTSDVTLYKS